MMTRTDAEQELWLERTTYEAIVVCDSCGDIAPRQIIEADGEAADACEFCGSVFVERES